MNATTSNNRKPTALLAAMVAALAMALTASPASAALDITSFDGTVLKENGDPQTQAGGRPFAAITEFFVSHSPVALFGVPLPDEWIKDAEVDLPPGFVGNPQAMPTCSQERFIARSSDFTFDNCPIESQVGYVKLWLGGVFAFGTAPDPKPLYSPLYNMEVPRGTPGLFAFTIAGTPAYLSFEMRTGEDYGLTAMNTNAPATLELVGVNYTFWGIPADSAHDHERGFQESGFTVGTPCVDPSEPASCTHPSGAPLQPFLTLPTSCTGPVETTLKASSWQFPDAFDTGSFLSHDNTEPVPNPIGADGCNAVPFEPRIEARPTTDQADSASGLDVEIEIPTSENCVEEEPEKVSCDAASAHLRDTTVTLPEELALNPSSANGLGTCSEEEFGYLSTDPDGMINTTPEAPDCPGASRLASVQVESPAIEDPLPGSVYLAEPHDNPFDSLIALYLAVDDEQTGIIVKLAGEVELDSDTGQISATFVRNPQLPFEEFDLNFFGGSTAALRTPAVCGEYDSEAEFTPWTAPEGQTEEDTDTWAIQSNCADSEGARPHAPAFDAGTVHPIAGAHSPFVMHLRREQGSQNIEAVDVAPPPGLLAKLAGTAICPEPFLAAAKSRDGADEQDDPSCPATSRLGRVVAGAGAGPAPYYAPGDVYLAGPYKGAPLSLAAIVPAVAGPFDLGTVLTRIAAHIDPRTARITAVSDPLPEMLEGIPLDVRTVDLALDRPQFTQNPTSCDPMAVDGLVASTLGALAPVSSRFQVGECGRLGFQPRVFLRLFGKRFSRGSNPRLRAIVVPRPGDANIGRTAVKMPRSLFLDQSHIRTVCTRVQFAANACPPGSVYGSAVATSPLVDYPLHGNVYLRSSDNKLPDLVADLHGPPHQPVRVEVVGRTDSVKGALRNTFDVVPDAPVSKFVLHLQAGKKSLLVASRNLCAGAQRARVNMAAQNGRQLILNPKIRIPCKKQRKRGKKGKGKRRNRAAVSAAVSKP